MSLLPQLAARVAGLPGGKVVLPSVCCPTLYPCCPSLTASLLALVHHCVSTTLSFSHIVLPLQITVRFGLPEDELTEEDVEQLRKDGASDTQVRAAACLPRALACQLPFDGWRQQSRLAVVVARARGGLAPSLSCPTHGSTPHLLTACLVPPCPAPFRSLHSAAGAGGAAVAHRAQPGGPPGRLVPQQRPGGWVSLCCPTAVLGRVGMRAAVVV